MEESEANQEESSETKPLEDSEEVPVEAVGVHGILDYV